MTTASRLAAEWDHGCRSDRPSSAARPRPGRRAVFSRRFRAAFGESPHQYLLTRRLERAAALLSATDWTVAAVCFAVGGQSLGSFTTSFHRVFGLTPLAYRAACPPAEQHLRVPRCVALAYGRPANRTFREDQTALAS
ncbi:MAG TPA: helix-turn-helix transcriptional regulator [Trebonia sp.]